jgi:hypothetical protein
MSHELLTSLGLLLGASVASGIRVYATVAVLGFLGRAGVMHLPAGLRTLENGWVILIAAALYLVEFVADKIPAFDSFWDTVHTFVRIPAAALLGYAALGDLPEVWRLGAALLCGTVALSSHGIKAGARLAINTSPEPISNWTASFAEELSVAGLLWLAIAHPIVSGIVALGVVLLATLLAIVLFRGVGRLFRRLTGRRPASALASVPGDARSAGSRESE